jgi:hypothetical protein
MKRINLILFVGMFLMLTGSGVLSGCKKKSSPVVPAFSVTATTVQLQAGGEGLQFYAKCTNTDVKLTKVTITDPLGANTVTYNLNGNYYVLNQVFMLEDQNSAYTKEIGTWSFYFVGNLTSDGSSFTVGAALSVGK